MQSGTLDAKLKSNATVTLDDEAELVRRFIGRFERKRACLDDEINELQNKLEALSQQKRELEVKISDHKRLVCHRHLPAEILTMIFRLCFPQGVNPSIDAREAPLKFGHVSSEWRKIVMAAPELWTSVHIDVPDVDVDPSKASNNVLDTYEDLLTEWISRSKSLPLSFSFVENAIYPFCRSQEAREQYAARLLRLLEIHTTRWSHVHLEIPIEIISKNFAFASPNMNLAQLQSLSIRFTNHLGIAAPQYPVASNVVHSLLRSPSLRTLCLEDVSLIRSQYATLPANWKNITDLTLGCDTGYTTNRGLFPRNALFILSYFTQLETCNITIFQDAQPNFFSVMDITLPHLRAFAVRISLLAAPTGGFEEGIATFFSALSLPRLSQFEYDSRVISSHLPPFLHLFRRPHNLIVLKLLVTGISKVQLLSCLTLFPNIQELYLSSSSSKELLPFLNTNYQGSLPCPNLKHIGIDCDPVISFDEFAEIYNVTAGGPRVERSERYLLKAAEYFRRADLEERIRFIWGRFQRQRDPSRMRQPGEQPQILKSVDLRVCEKFRSEAERRLAPLIDEGLEVYFQDDYYLDIPQLA